MRSLSVLLLVILTGCLSQDQTRITAQEALNRNLAAVGGADKLRNLDSLILNVVMGSALVTPSEKATLYLKKPNLIKQEGLFRAILFTKEKQVINTGEKKIKISGENLENMAYRAGFYHNGFSLMKWEKFFPTAVLEQVKDYGLTKQYKIVFPKGENHRDLIVYLDANSFLIDRLVYEVKVEKVGHLKIVNRLRDYKDFEGIKLPTRLVFDKVGWEANPTQFLIKEVKINPEIPDALFASAEVDFGHLTREENRVTGQIRGDMDGVVLTNLREKEMAYLKIKNKDWVRIKTNETEMKVKYLDNIQRNATEIKPKEIYLCRYFVLTYPRLILMAPGVDVSKEIPCEAGDPLICSKLD